MISVKNWKFHLSLFFDHLSRKLALLNYKNINFTKSRNCIFFKGGNPWFSSKTANLLYVFWPYKPRNNVWWSSSKKTSPPRLSKYGFYIVVILYFLQGSTYDLGQKMEFSSLLVFKQNGPWNNVCWPSSYKTSLPRLKIWILQTRHVEIFSKGVNPWFSSKVANFLFACYCRKWTLK